MQLATNILRHMVEDPVTLQMAMEAEITATFAAQSAARNGGRIPLRTLLTTLASVAMRDPVIFQAALESVCVLDQAPQGFTGGRSGSTLVLRKAAEGLKAGANVLMPNFTPAPYKKLYEIYPNKRCISESTGACGPCMESLAASIGRTVA